jgi:hypothetical protein
MKTIIHLSVVELEAGLENIRQSPKNQGRVELIVCRPATDERKILEVGELSLSEGLLGDDWRVREGGDEGEPIDRAAQITVMNSRVIALLAQDKERWPLAGDQFYVDLDLSSDNLPAGTRLSLGTAILEVTAEPHTGCKKFAARFGPDATRFVNSREGKQLHLRGINARVVQAGTVRTGDLATKLPH